MIRTFLAWELPNNLLQQLQQVQKQLIDCDSRGINWVAPNNLHITLLFVGDTKPNQVQELSSFFATHCGKPFTLTNPRLEIIPAHNPRLIWAAFDTPDKSILRLGGPLKNHLHNLGFSTDSKPLRLHVTLGRVKFAPSQQLVQTVLSTKIQPVATPVTRATFYQSTLRPQGPIYKPLASYNLTQE